MKYLFTILFSLGAFVGMSQMPGNVRSQNMNQGQLYGKIIDAATNKPIEGASIQLIQNKMDTVTKKKRDFTIAILMSDKKGEFLIDQLPAMGTFNLNISSIGYVTYNQKVGFDINMGAAKSGDMSSLLSGVIKDLGNIKLDVDSKELESVVVTASKPLLQMNLDRKVYNVEKDLSAAGGTALDIMKNVPSLNVDIDGNVSLRNSSPQIFVDGRPSNLTLDQIPADQISSVEIITNPSAKYDASGGGSGILNIVLKKARKSGYNGNLRVGIDSYGRPGGGGDINIRQGKVNFFTSLYVNLPKATSTGSTNRTDFITADSFSLLSQENAPEFKGGFGYGRIGLDYFMDNRNTFTLSGFYSKRKFETNDVLNINRNYYK
ncbi:MAG: carboxypeptidase regulatory-like domain-containing protein, partial [Ferruginibacter sp.]